jgi:DNA polymerase elongation subunit (family B)
MNWIEAPAGSYTLRDKKTSHCQIELDIDCHAFISHPPVESWSKVAPLRILSFDIECAGRKGIFPEAEKDPVIQIANMVTRQGQSHEVALPLQGTNTFPSQGIISLSFAMCSHSTRVLLSSGPRC